MTKLSPRPLAFVLLSIFLAAGSLGPARAATPASVVDQAFVSPHNLVAVINDCCRFAAQTFTAGRSGTLTGININVLSTSLVMSFPLHVALRTVTPDGAPGPTILGETTVASGSAPLSLLIHFPQTITIQAGVQYAIVINYEGAPPPAPGQALGAWTGATGDPYPGGGMYFSYRDGISWFQSEGDLHFRTYVTEVLKISLDIKPGGFPNSINPSSRGNIPVAILTTDATDNTGPFDATTVDPGTVRLGPAGAGAARYSLEDVDGDGDIDLLLHFNTQDTGIQCGDLSATLTGKTFDGREIQGTDAIRTVGCRR
jgi:hypothetical protein